MNGQAGSLSNTFNWKSMAWGIAWGLTSFFVLGVTDYLFFHDHPLGQEIIRYVEVPIMNFFDMVINFVGLGKFARNPEFLTAAGKACLTGMNEFGFPIPCGPA